MLPFLLLIAVGSLLMRDYAMFVPVMTAVDQTSC